MSSSKPTTVGELQLYKVLQRANLLSYYESFICQGGDDVQQLCEAGEEEFLEIMALVGMACKPLHVRRLQKSLQEWVTRPGIFRSSNASFQYLPTQSIPLTSVGLDVQDIPMPAQTIHPNAGKPKPKEPAFSTPGSLNSNANVFKLHNSSKRPNGQAFKGSTTEDKEIHDDPHASVIMDSMVQKYLSSPRIPTITDDVLSQLHADKTLKDIGIALSADDNNMLETLVADFVKKNLTIEAHSTTRHEALVHEAAVKLCLTDQKFLLKKSELSTSAEKIACDVESNLSRRSSMHLHGSTKQPHAPSLNQTLQNKKLALERRLEESHMVESDSQENDRLNDPDDSTPDSLSPLEDKIQFHKTSKETASAAVTTLGSISSDLAELAKAHNLSLGNLQSLPSSSEPSLQKGRDNIPQEKSKCQSPVSHTLQRGTIHSTHQTTDGEKESPTPSPRAVRLGKRKLSGGSRDFDGSKKLIAAAES